MRVLGRLLGLAAGLAAGLAFLCPAGAGPSVIYPGTSPMGGALPASPVVFRYLPTVVTGARIQEDANVVSHVTFGSSANSISDKNAAGTTLNTWTANGTVPAVTSSPWINGPANGSGPFSTSNFFSIAAPGAPFNFAGNFTVCIGFTLQSTADSVELMNDGYYNGSSFVNGWRVIVSSGAVFFETSGASQTNYGFGSAIAGPNIFCTGLNGTTPYGDLNGTVQTGTSASYTPNVSLPVLIGKLASQSGSGNDYIYEIYATTTAPTSALLQSIEQRYLGMLGTAGEAMAFTRATTATDDESFGTCATPPCVFTWPAGVPRIDSRGLLVEPASTNVNEFSEQFDNAWYSNSGTVAVTPNTTVAPDGNTTADTIASSTVNGYRQSGLISASNSFYSASVWAESDSASDGALFLNDITASSTLCSVVIAHNTGWQRYTCTSASKPTANDSLRALISPSGAGTGSVIAWGEQVEASPFPTQYIPTTSAAVTRNEDVVSTSLPSTYLSLAGSGSGTFTPEWSQSQGANYISGHNGIGVLAMLQQTQGYPNIDFYVSPNIPQFTDGWTGSGNAFVAGANTSQTFTAGTSLKVQGDWDVVKNQTICSSTNSGSRTCVACAPSTSVFPTSVTLALTGSIFVGDNLIDAGGWIKDVCVGSSRLGCAP